MQNRHNGLDIRSKIWIEVDGEPVFGRGRRFLLEAIDSHGSINRAAKEAEGHGGLCIKCDMCRYPVCPFGKQG
jgi:hypothetical protein